MINLLNGSKDGTSTAASKLPSGMSPAEQILAQLGRLKWAAGARAAEMLRGLYTARSEQVIHHADPEGRTEIAGRPRPPLTLRPLLS